ncbi:MAG TPA: hypothetical protein VIV60_14265, partial [Polyangiaceae bacterium]
MSVTFDTIAKLRVRVVRAFESGDLQRKTTTYDSCTGHAGVAQQDTNRRQPRTLGFRWCQSAEALGAIARAGAQTS